ncbi:MAG TPA: PIN domain-containing protein [Candidatus Sulfotelmatobacter sp.]|nr:PIN domain-containing protein [Candidatus Sulfotelmatobacter sp.]
MTFLLDTNIVSETSKPLPDSRVVSWLKSNRGLCALSSVTSAEMRYGIERLPNGKRKSALEKKLRFLVEDYADMLYEFDGAAAYEWGRYAAELEAEHGSDWWKRFDIRDTQIAAIAREYGLTIATRNTTHFPFCSTVDPFNA